MDTLVVNISWVYVLSIMGALVAIAYCTHGSLTGLETDIGWLKDTIGELAINAENVTAKLFKKGPPASLTAAGYHALARSGLRSYIDNKRSTLLAVVQAGKLSNPHEIQRRVFRLLADLPFEDAVAQHLNSFAFNNGLSLTILRRVGAIYLRGLIGGSN